MSDYEVTVEVEDDTQVTVGLIGAQGPAGPTGPQGPEGGTSDHGALTGLADDDHTQYSLADGSRAFTGEVAGVTPTVDASLATKKYVDDNAGGGGIAVARFADVGLGGPNDGTNWTTVEFNSAFAPGYRRVRSSGAQNDAAILDMPALQAGTYTFWFVGEASVDSGIMSVQIDDGAGGWTTLGTLDLYNGSFNRPHYLTLAGVTVTETGAARRLRLLMATKNASSSSFFGAYLQIGLWRTGA